MTYFSKILLCSVLFVSLAGMAHGSDLDAFIGQKGILKIAGGTAHIPVMKEAAELIMISNPDIRITIAGGGTGVGIKQVGEGCPLPISSRPNNSIHPPTEQGPYT
jgi:phosphate transport system substrate-binding protein